MTDAEQQFRADMRELYGTPAFPKPHLKPVPLGSSHAWACVFVDHEAKSGALVARVRYGGDAESAYTAAMRGIYA